MVRTSLRSTTWSQYHRYVTDCINPVLGDVNLRDLKSAQIQSLYNLKIAEGRGAWTIHVIHVVIHCSLAQAIMLRHIVLNPDDGTTPPTIVCREMRFYDEGQSAKFLVAAQDDKNEAIYYLALYTGMRQSELLGFRWPEIDLDKKTIQVQWLLRRDFNNGDFFISPKLKAGIRAILLGVNGIVKLQEHWQRQYQARVLAGNRWVDNKLIFPTSIGTPVCHSNLVKYFTQIIERAGLPAIRIHGLRHSSASLILNHGVPPIIASRRLGHSRVSITLDTNSHLIPEFQGEVADLLDELVTPIGIKLHTTAHEIDNIQTG